MLSQRTRYAARALQHLADRYGEGPVQLTEIVAAQNIPAKFLTVILSEMKRAGLVETMRGKVGGYWLARPPQDITYGDIVRLTRGSLALVPCASRLNHEPCVNCVDEAGCRLRAVMLTVRDETANILDRIRLSDRLAVDQLAGDPSAADQTPIEKLMV
ncbi:RrF2 family transcriptional regulator [Sphingomonas montana]|uniref:RrF2 family transcriptional regulator n=1 Tax=Sphingomonas montana TaxID=1843236 RepID=UPI00096CE281|nr:Rrf2 family transcriptional regulator [Sphingomonas montana]